MYKECNIHLLPTDNDSPLFLIQGKLYYSEDNQTPPKNSGKNQYLYITDDSEIKEGDWCLKWGGGKWNIVYMDSFQYKLYNEAWNEVRYKKIIATTNASIQWTIDKSPYPMEVYGLPQIPKQFIEYYIGEYNAGRKFEKVFVEFNTHTLTPPYDVYVEEISTTIKLSPTNEIYIKPVEEKVYSRDEVKEIAESAYHFGRLNSTINMPKFDNWIEENLK